MATTEKTPNYTTAQEATIRSVADANGGKLTWALAQEIATRDDMRDNDGNLRKARSITAKVTRMGIPYQGVEKTSKDGSPIAKKDGIVGEIARLVGLNVETLASLDKAQKPALVALRDTLAARAA